MTVSKRRRGIIQGWLALLPVVCSCTRAPQPVPADPPLTAAADATAVAAAGGPPPASGAARSAEVRQVPHRYVLPAGCVPPGKKFACNPISNEGCSGQTGEACDDDTKGGFTCYPPPNEVSEGDECNDKEGPSCAPGLSCDTPGESRPDGVCRKLCCSDNDCARAQAKRCAAVDREYGTFGFCR